MRAPVRSHVVFAITMLFESGSAAALLATALLSCAKSPLQPTAAPSDSSEVCGTPAEPGVDAEDALIARDFDRVARSPCYAAFDECLNACQAHACDIPTGGTLPIGGGCAHRCGRGDAGWGYLERARRFRRGECW